MEENQHAQGRTLHIVPSQVNRPIVEDIPNEKFMESAFFGRQYSQILSCLDEYVHYYRPNDNRESDKVLINNVFAFVGERGSGKTSCMTSISRLLTSGRLRGFSRYEHLGEAQFTSIDLIDPSYFDESHNIVAFVVATLYKAFREKDRSNEAKDFDRNCRNELIDAFAHTQRSMRCLLGAGGNGQGEYESDDIDSLSSLSSAIDLKDDIHRLVQAYLKFVKKEDGFLVLSIDDIDLNVSEADTMAEQIRKYLVNPKIVILLAAKLDQLATIKNLHYAEKYDSLLKENHIEYATIEEMTSQFLTKFAPHNQRVYMPTDEVYLNIGLEVQGGNGLEKQKDNGLGEQKDNGLEKQEDNGLEVVQGDTRYRDNVTQIVPKLIFNCTRYLFYSTKQTPSYIIPRNLRKLCQLIALLWSMKPHSEGNQAANKDAFKKYLFGTWVQDNLSQDDRQRANSLLTGWRNGQLNKIALDVLQEKYKDWIDSKKKEGTGNLDKGRDDLKKEISKKKEGTGNLDKGRDDLKKEISKKKEGTGNLDKGRDDLKKEISKKKEGTGNLDKGRDDLKKEISKKKEGTGNLDKGRDDLKKEITALFDDRNREYNLSVGDIMSLIVVLEISFESHSDKCFFFFIKTIYSMALYEAYDIITDKQDKGENSSVSSVMEPTDSNQALLYDPFADKKIEDYHKLVGGRFYNYRLNPVLAKETVEKELVSRSDRMIDYETLAKLINETVGNWRTYQNDKSHYNEAQEEELKDKVRLCEFFMLCCIRDINRQNAKSLDHYAENFRRTDSVYYNEAYAGNKWLYFDLGAFYFNITNMERCYKRYNQGENFWNLCKEDDKNEEKISLYAVFRKGAVDYRKVYKNPHAWQSWASIRNAEILLDLNQYLRSKCRSSDGGKQKHLARYFEALSKYEIKTYDRDGEGTKLNINFNFAEEISELLSKDSISSRFDSIYSVVYTQGDNNSMLVNIEKLLIGRFKDKNRTVTVKSYLLKNEGKGISDFKSLVDMAFAQYGPKMTKEEIREAGNRLNELISSRYGDTQSVPENTVQSAEPKSDTGEGETE